MWTSKLNHIRVKRNHWCLFQTLYFNFWEINRSTGSTLPQYTFSIGEFTFIVSWCTNNIICCIFATWMTSFIIWKDVVRILFVSLSWFIFFLPRELSALFFIVFNCFLRHSFDDSWKYFEVLQMAQPHIILWWSAIGSSWGCAKEWRIVSLIITSCVSACLDPSKPPSSGEVMISLCKCHM